MRLAQNHLLNTARRVRYQQLVWPTLDRLGLAVYLRRDDLLSSACPGNKFYKLFLNLDAVLKQGYRTVVSFGGAYSNHIHALAAMGKALGIQTVGIIRGESVTGLSPTLVDAKAWGMHLLHVDRHSYRHKDLSSVMASLRAIDANYYLLPEGGENILAVKGCQVIGKTIAEYFHRRPVTVCMAVGTGTTLAGVVSGVPHSTPCLGFSVLKGEDRLSSGVWRWLAELDCEHDNWRIDFNFHHGGYAKVTPELLAFMRRLECANDLVLEPVYLAKVLWGIEQLALQGYWCAGSNIVAIHGGGLQGRRGFKNLE